MLLQGDEGSGLICDNKLTGILSFVIPTFTKVNNIYTRVYNYLDWIRSVTDKVDDSEGPTDTDNISQPANDNKLDAAPDTEINSGTEPDTKEADAKPQTEEDAELHIEEAVQPNIGDNTKEAVD